MLADRMGIEIDFCPMCRGVWLDRGELEKLVERSLAVELAAQGPQPLPPPQPYQRDERFDDDGDVRGEDWDRPRRKRRKRESFLSEIFDFD
jgi:Zn-finger nucleic acid-binding protein